MSAPPSPAARFALRRVGFDEAGELMRAAMAPFQSAPARLAGLFVLLMLPMFLLTGSQIPALLLRNAYAAVAYAGYTFALDAARSEPPGLRHLGVVLGFDRGKLTLLTLSGVIPVLCGLLVLYGIWGMDPTSAFLAELSQSPEKASPAMGLQLRVAANLASMPFTFVAPVCALYRWSGSRSMGGSLLACILNWRWVLAFTLFFVAADELMAQLSRKDFMLVLLGLLGSLALQMFSLAWTLALARRSFPQP